jgi:hypothetical protein
VQVEEVKGRESPGDGWHAGVSAPAGDPGVADPEIGARCEDGKGFAADEPTRLDERFDEGGVDGDKAAWTGLPQLHAGADLVAESVDVELSSEEHHFVDADAQLDGEFEEVATTVDRGRHCELRRLFVHHLFLL